MIAWKKIITDYCIYILFSQQWENYDQSAMLACVFTCEGVSRGIKLTHHVSDSC